jgi:hypothetical protein
MGKFLGDFPQKSHFFNGTTIAIYQIVTLAAGAGELS